MLWPLFLWEEWASSSGLTLNPPSILDGGVWRPASVGSCDPHWLSGKAWALAGCGCVGGARALFIPSRGLSPQAILGELQGPPFWLLIVKPSAELSCHFKNIGHRAGDLARLETRGHRTWRDLNSSQGHPV